MLRTYFNAQLTSNDVKRKLFSQLKTSTEDKTVIIENQIDAFNSEIDGLETLRQEATNGIVTATAELYILVTKRS